MAMYRRAISAIAALGLALGLTFVAPSLLGTEANAQAATYESFTNSFRSERSVDVRTNTGAIIGVRPGAFIASATAGFAYWRLTSGWCANVSINGGPIVRHIGNNLAQWKYFPNGAEVWVYVFYC
jgi:hypothetical protein